MKIRKILGTLLLLTLFGSAFGQELQCVVDIQTPQVGSDKQVFEKMKDDINKYVNFRKWTDMTYENEERIKCRMQFIISNRPTDTEFQASLQVQLIRPVYNSNYESVVLNIKDQNVYFTYTPFNPLEFSENNYIDELTSILNFYCYMLVGFDQETFALKGGNKWFQKAQNIVNLAASSGGNGWKNYDGNQNRFWLVTDMLDNAMSKIHNIFYAYHRQGLDKMEKNIQLARKTILQSLRELDNLNQRYPSKYITRVFLTAKSPEIIDIFKKADLQDKRDLIKIMEKVDPAHFSDYEKVLKAK